MKKTNLVVLLLISYISVGQNLTVMQVVEVSQYPKTVMFLLAVISPTLQVL